jgi:hypothetical protein
MDAAHNGTICFSSSMGSTQEICTWQVRDWLRYNANNWSSQKYSKGVENESRPKLPCAEVLESGKRQENDTNVSSVIVGTQELEHKGCQWTC